MALQRSNYYGRRAEISLKLWGESYLRRNCVGILILVQWDELK